MTLLPLPKPMPTRRPPSNRSVRLAFPETVHVLPVAKVLGWLAVALLLLLGTRDVSAQGTPPPGAVTDDEVNEIAHQLYCPVCENIPLDVCPTTACIQWRGTIREKLEAGWSEQQILDYFVAQYGERVLARPSTRGLNILIWVLPPVIVIGGGFFLWRFLRQQTRPAAESAAPAMPMPADEYAQRLEQELKKRI